MKHILLRHAEDDFRALIIAQGMERAGAEVFSVSYNGQSEPNIMGFTHGRFIVWGRYEDPVTCDLIDSAIAENDNA